jgi:hypothetical protein
MIMVDKIVLTSNENEYRLNHYMPCMIIKRWSLNEEKGVKVCFLENSQKTVRLERPRYNFGGVDELYVLRTKDQKRDISVEKHLGTLESFCNSVFDDIEKGRNPSDLIHNGTQTRHLFEFFWYMNRRAKYDLEFLASEGKLQKPFLVQNLVEHSYQNTSLFKGSKITFYLNSTDHDFILTDRGWYEDPHQDDIPFFVLSPKLMAGVLRKSLGNSGLNVEHINNADLVDWGARGFQAAFSL